MDYKKFNITLVITVIVLLAVAVFAFLKVLFSNSKALEWGSVSDFISSISTFGTLLVAFFAYKAAPQWIRQKQNEEGFKHVSTMLAEYDVLLEDVRKFYFKLIYVQPTPRNAPFYEQTIPERLNNLYPLKVKSKACQRWDIVPSPEVETLFVRIEDFYLAAYDYVLTFYNIPPTSENSDEVRMRECFEEIKKSSEFFHRNIEEIFKFPK
ncbi:hypothetical protein ACQ092_000267 [Escherichia coli]